MIDKYKNIDLRLKFIQVYEDFNKEIPNEMIDIFKKVRYEIGFRDKSFVYSLDLNDVDFVDLVLNIEVEYEEIKNNKPYCDKDIIYYSNINIGDLIESKNNIKLPIIIKDVKLNNDKLYSVISHELRHIYDFYTINEESDFNSFINSLNYAVVKKESDKYFDNFLNLVYLSLEHELVARNTMIYENFINCKCSKNELISEFKKTYVYKSFETLNEFDYSYLNDVKYLNLINKFIDRFGGSRCEDLVDIETFFKGWDKYFKDKSYEYLKESYKVLDKIYNVIKENKSELKIRNVKDILIEIQNKYILRK